MPLCSAWPEAGRPASEIGVGQGKLWSQVAQKGVGDRAQAVGPMAAAFDQHEHGYRHGDGPPPAPESAALAHLDQGSQDVAGARLSTRTGGHLGMTQGSATVAGY